jgi:hypothetical protein
MLVGRRASGADSRRPEIPKGVDAPRELIEVPVVLSRSDEGDGPVLARVEDVVAVSHALGKLDECLNDGGEVILLSLNGTERGEVGGGVVWSELRERGRSLS